MTNNVFNSHLTDQQWEELFSVAKMVQFYLPDGTYLPAEYYRHNNIVYTSLGRRTAYLVEE